MFCENWFSIYMGYGYGLVKLEGEFPLFQFFAGMNDRFSMEISDEHLCILRGMMLRIWENRNW